MSCGPPAKLTPAPEYALDNTLAPANDLYSLGCVLYALHIGRPPFATRGSMQALRENADGLSRREYARGAKWDRAGNELKGEPIPFRR